MADEYSGKITEIREDNGKLIVLCSLSKGKLHTRGGILCFEDNPKIKRLLESSENFLLRFGGARITGNKAIFGNTNRFGAEEEKFIVYISHSDLIYIEFLSDPREDDKFLVSRRNLHVGNFISIQFE